MSTAMSARLVKAIKAGKVVLQNRTNAEVAVRFVGHNGQKAQQQLAPSGTIELCPKLCPPNYVKFSNVSELIKRRVIRIQEV